RDVWASWPGAVVGPFADDVDAVVEALTSGAYPQLLDRTVLDLGRFTPAQQADATSAAKSSLSRQLPGTSDIRALLAGARIAFQASPERAATSRPLILRRAMRTVTDKTRHADRRTPLTTAADRAAGAALYDRVTDRTGARR
ncbi:MAG: hypothetical protein HOV94_40815, partial [Saccharothrix sp.]|nr:hypothetical protein [Saccharothrix sp.]